MIRTPKMVHQYPAGHSEIQGFDIGHRDADETLTTFPHPLRNPAAFISENKSNASFG